MASASSLDVDASSRRRERNGRSACNPPNAEAAGPVRLAIRPPTGLEIRNVDERSDVSSTIRGSRGLELTELQFSLPWRAEKDAAAIDLDHADPLEFHTGLKSKQSILILAYRSTTFSCGFRRSFMRPHVPKYRHLAGFSRPNVQFRSLK